MTVQEAIDTFNQGINKLVAMRDEIYIVRNYYAKMTAQGKTDVKALVNTNITEAKALVDQFNNFVQTL